MTLITDETHEQVVNHADMKADTAHLQTEVDALSHTHESDVTRLQTAQTNIQSDLTAVHQQQGRQQNEVDDVTLSQNMTHLEILKAIHAVSQLQSDMSRLTQQHTADMSRLTQQHTADVHRLTSEIRNLTFQNHQHENDIQNLTFQSQQQGNVIQSLTSENHQQRNDIANLTTSTFNLQSENQHLQAGLYCLTNQSDQHAIGITSLVNQTNQHTKDITNLTTSNVELQTAVQNLEQKDATLDHQMTAISGEMRNLTAVVGELLIWLNNSV
jgi:chromosome segregation ATPase